jgi:hypothetical protein
VAIADLHVQIETTISSIRRETEDEIQKQMSEIKRLHGKMFDLETMCQALVP